MPSGETGLCDTGLLVALFASGQHAREGCQRALRDLRGILLTTLPVLTEAFYFLDSPAERELLWSFMFQGGLQVAELSFRDMERMRVLMEKYADQPMDFADASLVALSERLRLRKIFTLDSHFRAYRPRHANSFEILP